MIERFADIVDATDQLSPDDQLALVDIIRRRLSDQERDQMAKDIADGKSEFDGGSLKPATAKTIMDDFRDES